MASLGSIVFRSGKRGRGGGEDVPAGEKKKERKKERSAPCGLPSYSLPQCKRKKGKGRGEGRKKKNL